METVPKAQNLVSMRIKDREDIYTVLTTVKIQLSQ